MEVLSKGNTKNIGGNTEYITVKTSTGLEMRLIIDLKTLEVGMYLDHHILRECPQTEDFTPYVKVCGFRQD